MLKIAIIGAGELGQQFVNLINSDTDASVYGYYDDYEIEGIEKNGVKVIGKIQLLYQDFQKNKFDALLIAIGYNHLQIKKELFERIKSESIPFYTIIHSTCIIDKTAVIKEGSVIYPGTVIDRNVIIGNNVIINLNCTISHDTHIQNNTFLSPSVAVAGFVKIEEQCFIGINSTIINNVHICSSINIAAGTVVINDLVNPGLYAGNPARFIK